MATGWIYNAFGHYEEKDGEQGIHLYFGGIPFWLPYQKATAIPNWNLREVDHDKSTPQGGTVGVLVYQNVVVQGEYIVNELCNKGVPIEPRNMGIMPITGRATGRMITVPAGIADTGTPIGMPLTVEVMEREPTKAEREEAEKKADEYRRDVIANYFTQKRERMTGGYGRNTPDDRTRIYMQEMNVQDIDDVTTHQKAIGGLDAETIRLIVELTRESTAVNAEELRKAVETVRRGGKAQLVRKPEVSEEEQERRRQFGIRMAEARKKAVESKQEEPVGIVQE